jgi:hypothetical protein
MGRAFESSEAKMTDDAMAKRGKGLEDEYFYRKEKELVEKLRRRRQEEEQIKELAEATGVPDEDVLKTLSELGFGKDTLPLLYLVPLLSVAWADNKVTGAEKKLILEAARLHGVEEGSPANQKLEYWLTSRPDDKLLDQTLSVIAHLAQTDTLSAEKMDREELLDLSTRIAAASGGILGLVGTISDDEQAVLDRIAAQLGKT